MAGSRSSRFGLAGGLDTAQMWTLSSDRSSSWRSACCFPARPRTRCRPCSRGCRTVPSRTARTSEPLSGAAGRPGAAPRCRLGAAAWPCEVQTPAGLPALAGHLRGATQSVLSSPVPVAGGSPAGSDYAGGDDGRRCDGGGGGADGDS